MFSCDYNGWADVPEEEREGIDAFEAARIAPHPAQRVRHRRTLLTSRTQPDRRAA